MSKNIAILFKHDENWIGGTYYILNLIHAIKLLPESEIPLITIICENEKDFESLKSETGYKNLKKVIYKCGDVNNAGWFKRWKWKKLFYSMDAVFPYPFKEDDCFRSVKRKLFWIGDFQEKYLPDLFSEKALKNRESINLKIAASNGEVVFSSQSAMKDFDRFYPNNKCTKHLLQFAVTHPPIGDLNADEVLKKYDVMQPYFISPNQFWAHKNHLSIINAVKKLIEDGQNILLLFTGKEYDYRYPEYTENLKRKVVELELQNNIKFLGFIDRADQLVLMKHSNAVIQASLFEGWSTVVEDSKALNCRLILSDIAVHREQEPPMVTWFDPNSVDALVKAITTPFSNKMDYDYQINKLNYVKQFNAIINFKSN